MRKPHRCAAFFVIGDGVRASLHKSSHDAVGGNDRCVAMMFSCEPVQKLSRLLCVVCIKIASGAVVCNIHTGGGGDAK